MAAIFEMPLVSETLTQDELIQITGCFRRADRTTWLQNEGWNFVKNKSGEPIVGRLYARLKLAGINPGVLATSGGWLPDISNVK